MIPKQLIDFLTDLKENNNRDWFQANKALYENSKNSFELFISEIITAISGFDSDIKNLKAKDCVFRIYRDVRFSKNKSPYKTHMGGFMVKGGRKAPYAGYYLQIEPGASFFGGGIYMPQSPVLKAIRNEIYYNPEKFKAILNDGVFRKLFKELEPSDRLKRPPKDFSSDFKEIELLKFKSYVVIHSVPDELIILENFLPYALEVFKAMYPLNSFLNRAVDMME